MMMHLTNRNPCMFFVVLLNIQTVLNTSCKKHADGSDKREHVAVSLCILSFCYILLFLLIC